MTAEVQPDVPATDPTVPAAAVTRIGGLNARTWQWIRWTLLSVYAVLVVGYCVLEGVPVSVVVIAIVIVAGLVLTRVGQSRRRIARVLVDWAPFVAIMFVYNRSRGLATHIGMPVHISDVAHAERWLFGGTVPTVWLQHHLYTPGHVHWYDAACTLVYTTYFIATPILASVLWLRDRALWVRYISRVVVLWVAGLITFILFPEAPPWLAAEHRHVIPPVARLSGQGWIWLHAGNLTTLLHRAQSTGSNPVAAMPSLHTALSTLVAIFIGKQIRSRWRWLLALYPMAMGFTLVYTGEHYVLDLVAGVGYALVVHFAFNRWEAHRRRAKETPPAAPAADADAVPT